MGMVDAAFGMVSFMVSINVLRKVKIDNKWLLLPVAKTNGKFDWPHVLLHGTPIVAAGTFYLDYREGGRRVRRAVGSHPRDAKVALASQTSVLGLRDAGMVVEDAPQLQTYRPIAGLRIADVIADYIAHPPLKLRSRSLQFLEIIA